MKNFTLDIGELSFTSPVAGNSKKSRPSIEYGVDFSGETAYVSSSFGWAAWKFKVLQVDELQRREVFAKKTS